MSHNGGSGTGEEVWRPACYGSRTLAELGSEVLMASSLAEARLDMRAFGRGGIENRLFVGMSLLLLATVSLDRAECL